MGNLDPTKIAIVLIVALVVLGPEKLPGFTKQIGAWWGEFQRVRNRLQAEINGAVNQINSAASPFTDTIKSASSGVGGLFPSIFQNSDNQPLIGESRSSTAPQAVPGPVASGNDSNVSREREGPDFKGWGSSEGESGYRYGDPRLN